MSRELPILFNTDMVRAILREPPNNKTATRRIIKRKKVDSVLNSPARKENPDIPDEKFIKCLVDAPYHKGDILYVRETWRVGAWDIKNQMIAFDYKDGTCGKLVYIHSRELFNRLVDQSREDARKAKCEYNGADFVWEKGKSPCRWHPSIHMPKEAARIWLKVTDVRVERLHDMTLDDFLSEGVVIRPEAFNDPENAYLQAKDAFVRIWDSTIKKEEIYLYGWDGKPWTWVIEFERCEKPEH